MRRAVIVSALRTAVGKAPKGTLRNTRPDDMAAEVIRAIIERTPQLDPASIDDVILGCAMPEAEQGVNVARIASLVAGLPHEVPAMTVNRFCSSGLQTIAMAAERIMCGNAEAILAGGTETMSMIPMGGHKVSPNPRLASEYPDAYLSMGLTAENVAAKYEIGREAQDEFSFESHRKAIAAIDGGKFKGEIVALTVLNEEFDERGKIKRSEITFDTDEGPRRDTSIEALGKLKASFHVSGTITAGNSSQMSDGAAIALVMSEERAAALGLKPMARFVAYAVAGVDPEIMGIGPVRAIPKALKSAGLTLGEIDLIELNEAFAAQSIAVIEELGLDRGKINVNGGAIALGHPLGCSGAKLTATILNELRRRGGRYGMVTMCVGGGMGAAGIYELLS